MTEDADWMRPDGDLGAYVATPEPPPPPRRGRGATIAIAAGAAVALVAGVLAVATINDNGGGGSPEAAVQKLFDALAHEDVLGAVDALVPAERDVVGDRLTKITGELARLGVLSDDLDLSHIPGGDLSFDGLKLRSEGLSDDVAVVTVTGDRMNLAVSAGDLPLGSLTRPLATRAGLPSPEPVSPVEARLVAVREGGEWHVSLAYSMAEEMRRDAGLGVPDFAAGVQPRGESSPEAAVRELARAASDLDARRLVELAPPGEGAALQDYAPLFLDTLSAYAAQAEAGGPVISVDALDLTSHESGDEARVVIDRLELTVASGTRRSSFGTDGRCLYYRDAGETEPNKVCKDDPGAARPFGPTYFGPFAISTVKEGGSWYVSPVRTWLDTTLDMLKDTSRDELEKSLADEGPIALAIALSPFPFAFLSLVGDVSAGSSVEESSSYCALSSPQSAGECVQAVAPPATVVATAPPAPLPTTTTVP